MNVKEFKEWFEDYYPTLECLRCDYFDTADQSCFGVTIKMQASNLMFECFKDQMDKIRIKEHEIQEKENRLWKKLLKK